MKHTDYKTTFAELFKLASEYDTLDKRDHNNILADFEKKDPAKIEDHRQNLEIKISWEKRQKLLNKFTTKEWVEATTISKLYNQNEKLEELLEFSAKKEQS